MCLLPFSPGSCLLQFCLWCLIITSLFGVYLLSFLSRCLFSLLLFLFRMSVYYPSLQGVCLILFSHGVFILPSFHGVSLLSFPSRASVYHSQPYNLFKLLRFTHFHIIAISLIASGPKYKHELSNVDTLSNFTIVFWDPDACIFSAFRYSQCQNQMLEIYYHCHTYTYKQRKKRSFICWFPCQQKLQKKTASK